MLDPTTKMVLQTHDIPYGAHIFVKDKEQVKRYIVIPMDPYNAVIFPEFSGKIAYEDIEQGVTTKWK